MIAVLFAIVGAVLAGCWGGDDKGESASRGGSIDVAIVDTPQTQVLDGSLIATADHVHASAC